MEAALEITLSRLNQSPGEFALLIDYVLVQKIYRIVPGGLRRGFGVEMHGDELGRGVAERNDTAATVLLQAVVLAAMSWLALCFASLFATFILLFACKVIVGTNMAHSPWFLMPLAAMSVLVLAIAEYIISSLRATAIRDRSARRRGRREQKMTAQDRAYPKPYDFWVGAFLAFALFGGLAIGVVLR
ncbi:hypothetical protein ABH931_007420 [Streptacidiphilus sp. MAP12-33]|uniref:hypothetical protein n=1 Tax=Streptacidiphilus sp. MAP12-33 TaxID=3156266 RepID=UPI003516520C